MNNKVYILIFTEGDFERVETQTSQDLALAYSIGVMDGGGLYGAGSCGSYVMPIEESDMRAEEDAEQVERAMTALADKMERDRIEATGAEP